MTDVNDVIVGLSVGMLEKLLEGKYEKLGINLGWSVGTYDGIKVGNFDRLADSFNVSQLFLRLRN